MKVSPSLYSSKKNVLDTVKIVRTSFSDYMHIDFYNKDIEQIKSDVGVIRKNSDLKIDMHLICKNPTVFLDDLRKIKPEYLAVQFENLENNQEFYSLLSCGLPNVGLAITQNTNFKEVEDLINKSDYVLLMTTSPGLSGFKFSNKSLNWIKDFKKHFPFKRIHVDGGVNGKVAIELRSLGIDCVVSGSYLMNSSSMVASVLAMKGLNKLSKAEDAMLDLKYLQVLKHNASLSEVLVAINEGQRGFVIMIDEINKEWGIITDGDVRRYIINTDKKHLDIQSKCAYNLVNKQPFVVAHDNNFEQILKKMLDLKIDKKMKFIVVTKYNKPVGILPIEIITKG